MTLRIYFWFALTLPAFCSSSETRELSYLAEGKRESVRLYGNINKYAYWFVDLLVGTPPQRTSVIIDTGSAVCAFSCDTCAHCGTHMDSVFNFSNSSTASWASCDHCPSGSCVKGHCAYSISYVEGSAISGYWFSDFVRLGGSGEGNIPVNSSLGCHTLETKLFYTQSVNGILGLAPSPLSGNVFPTILASLFTDNRINKSIFSICLAPEGGELVVGGYESAFHRENQMSWIPMRSDTFYSVSLTRMRVGNKVIPASSNTFTIIDSGTTLVYLAGNLFRSLAEHINGYILSSSVHKHGDRCFATTDRSLFPMIFFEFNGISLPWTPQDYLFIATSSSPSPSSLLCFAFQASSDNTGGTTILGASFFVNKNMVFDIKNSRLGIAPAECPSYTQRLEGADGPLEILPISTNSSKSDNSLTIISEGGNPSFASVHFILWPLLILVSISGYIYWRQRPGTVLLQTNVIELT